MLICGQRSEGGGCAQGNQHAARLPCQQCGRADVPRVRCPGLPAAAPHQVCRAKARACTAAAACLHASTRHAAGPPPACLPARPCRTFLVWMSYRRATAALIAFLSARTSTMKTWGQGRAGQGKHCGRMSGTEWQRRDVPNREKRRGSAANGSLLMVAMSCPTGWGRSPSSCPTGARYSSMCCPSCQARLHAGPLLAKTCAGWATPWASARRTRSLLKVGARLLSRRPTAASRRCHAGCAVLLPCTICRQRPRCPLAPPTTTRFAKRCSAELLHAASWALPHARRCSAGLCALHPAAARLRLLRRSSPAAHGSPLCGALTPRRQRNAAIATAAAHTQTHARPLSPRSPPCASARPHARTPPRAPPRPHGPACCCPQSSSWRTRWSGGT